MSDQEHGKRDIVLNLRDNNIKRISETHRSYDALQYPLICVHGEDGYHFGISHTHGTKLEAEELVSCAFLQPVSQEVQDTCMNELRMP